jgi:hypothetical protein
MQKVVEGVLANYEEFGVSGGEWLVILHVARVIPVPMSAHNHVIATI